MTGVEVRRCLREGLLIRDVKEHATKLTPGCSTVCTTRLSNLRTGCLAVVSRGAEQPARMHASDWAEQSFAQNLLDPLSTR